ncbi:hypothetical protein BH23CHL8_BH23CHL8_17350 [soil metagenome]
MGGVLVALWAALAVAIGVAYRPGVPLDVLVVAASFLPVLVAAVSLVRPGVARTQRDQALLTWLWIAAVLLTTSLLYNAASALAAGGPQPLVPSAEVAYAAFLALLCTSGFSLMALAEGRRAAEQQSAVQQPADEPPLAASIGRAVGVRGLTLALLAATGVASVFGSVLLLNDRNVPLDPSSTSRHGPTDPELLPPECDAPAALGPNASVVAEARASVDDIVVGEARMTGRRTGWDEAWSAAWKRGPAAGLADTGSPAPAEGGIAYRRVGEQAWLNLESDDLEAAGTTWREVEPNPFSLVGPQGLSMDGPPLALLGSQRGTIVPEDVGLEFIEGARARHCRTFLDGPTALATFLPLRWLLGGEPIGLPAQLPAWRGELDWWVFADGQLGRANVRISGLGTDAWVHPPGIRGDLEATLEALDRSLATDIGGPPG